VVGAGNVAADPMGAMGRSLIAHGIRAASLIVLIAAAACGGGSSPTGPTPPTSPPPLAGFSLDGDAADPSGATWTYRSTVGGVSYDLQGILFKPASTGMFPAVIISHGAGGNVNGYSRAVARIMVGWGLVCIATNYTHAGGVPPGSPGNITQPGASSSNVRRARALVDILASLGYVDLRRIAAHGHSMGAFVTSAVLSAHPDLFRVASHTAGGVRPDAIPGFAPADSEVIGIRAPYQLHHGDRDFVVLLAADERLAALLAARGVPNALLVYRGADHDDLSMNPLVFDRVRSWYNTHGLF
jgi:dienelactone hydrolase